MKLSVNSKNVRVAMAPDALSDLSRRTRTVGVLLPLVIGLLWYGGLPLRSFLVAIYLGMLAELWGMGKLRREYRFVKGLMVISAVYVTAAWSVLLHISSQFSVCLWVLTSIWATDIGAYAVGRILRGPKLAPTISPGKTWSGCIGGSIIGWWSCTVFASVFLIQTDHFRISIGWFAVGLVIASHSGDLLESWTKRRFGVKDSGTLLPGHGGLLDRLDSLLAVLLWIQLMLR
jgi:phosphatidate cytidylyltransferase